MNRFSDREIRELANIELKGIARMCLLLTRGELNKYLDYLINGLTSFKQGYNEENKE